MEKMTDNTENRKAKNAQDAPCWTNAPTFDKMVKAGTFNAVRGGSVINKG